MKLIIDAEQVWFTLAVPKADAATVARHEAMSADEKTALKARAAKMYEEQAQRYGREREISAADREWLATVLASGTISDKISAMLLQVQEAPIYSLEWIAKLLALAQSSSRHESYLALEALKDIYLTILPPASARRPLCGWGERPLTSDRTLTPTWLLLLSYFESVLLHTYGEFIKVVDVMLYDQVQIGREKAMRFIYELAKSGKGEKVGVLVGMLVNKLGDHARKVASRVIYYLQGIIEANEDLTLTVVKAVQGEATRPNATSDKAAFYGLLFFAQVRLSADSPAVTNALLQTYQHFLQIFLFQLQTKAAATETGKKRRVGGKDEKRAKKKDGAEEALTEEGIPRTIKVALTGLGRAIPFASASHGSGELTVYASKLVEIAGRIRSFPTLLQASKLIFKIFIHEDSLDEASLSILSNLISNHLLDYTRLGDAASSHATLFKLLYQVFARACTSDYGQTVDFLRSMVKALLAASTMVSNPAFAAAALLVANEAIRMKPALRLAITLPEDAPDAVAIGGALFSGRPAAAEAGSTSLFWELNILSTHYHPVVSRYAKTLLQSKTGAIDVSQETADPFATMTNACALDLLASKKHAIEA